MIHICIDLGNSNVSTELRNVYNWFSIFQKFFRENLIVLLLINCVTGR